jgi:hypothetical protein
MTPFKRLAESEGRDAWLETAAQQVRDGDPWALVSEQQAQLLGMSALARVRERSSRKGSRALAIAFAVIASSAALAAVGRVVLMPRAAPPPVLAPAPTRIEAPPVVAPPAPAPVTEAEPQPPVAAPVPAAAPPHVERKPRPAAVKSAPAPPPSSEDSALAAEAKLLLEALNQLRVEGDPDAALATLDAHDSQFPEGALKEEAAAARAEAHALKAGRSP